MTLFLYFHFVTPTPFYPPYTPGVLLRLFFKGDIHHAHFHSYNDELGDMFVMNDVREWESFRGTQLKRIVCRAVDPKHPLQELVVFVNIQNNEMLAVDVRDFGYVTYGLRKKDSEFDTGAILHRGENYPPMTFELRNSGLILD